MPATPQFRVITLINMINVLIKGLTISNGVASSGGIMIESGSTLTLKNCDLSNKLLISAELSFTQGSDGSR